LPRETRSLTFSGTPAALNQLLLAILAARLTPLGLQLRAAPGCAHLDVRFDGTPAGILAQIDQVNQVRQLAAPSAVPADAPAELWTSHQAIWDGADAADAADAAAPALVARLSVLPARIAAVCALVERAAAARSLAWRMVVQGVGAGYLRLAGNEGDEPALRATFLELREELAGTGGTGAAKPGDARDASGARGTGGTGGTLVALGCPLAVKRGLDVWGPAGDALPLMVRIKQHFDPDGTLSPGRFLGGI
jgi:glycolate oxidase FAD binding subunit